MGKDSIQPAISHGGAHGYRQPATGNPAPARPSWRSGAGWLLWPGSVQDLRAKGSNNVRIAEPRW